MSEAAHLRPPRLHAWLHEDGRGRLPGRRWARGGRELAAGGLEARVGGGGRVGGLVFVHRERLLKHSQFGLLPVEDGGGPRSTRTRIQISVLERCPRERIQTTHTILYNIKTHIHTYTRPGETGSFYLAQNDLRPPRLGSGLTHSQRTVGRSWKRAARTTRRAGCWGWTRQAPSQGLVSLRRGRGRGRSPLREPQSAPGRVCGMHVRTHYAQQTRH